MTRLALFALLLPSTAIAQECAESALGFDGTCVGFAELQDRFGGPLVAARGAPEAGSGPALLVFRPFGEVGLVAVGSGGSASGGHEVLWAWAGPLTNGSELADAAARLASAEVALAAELDVSELRRPGSELVITDVEADIVVRPDGTLQCDPQSWITTWIDVKLCPPWVGGGLGGPTNCNVTDTWELTEDCETRLVSREDDCSSACEEHPWMPWNDRN